MKSLIKRLLLRLFSPIADRLMDRFSTELTESSKSSPSVKIAQRALFLKYHEMAKNGAVPPLSETGFRNFSQFEEDGLLLFLFAVIGASRKLFVDIGAGDGINSNCANLLVNFGWHGLFIDGNADSVWRGSRFYEKHPDTWIFPPKFVHARVTRENINRLVEQAGFKGEVDLLSVDIDGNDYWIWDALDIVTPRVVVIETHVEFGLNSIVVPYDKDYVYPGSHPDYFGASAPAMAKLARKKGYRLVGANLYGFNTIYVRNGVGENLIPAVSVESILTHPRNAERFKLFDAVRDREYVRV